MPRKSGSGWWCGSAGRPRFNEAGAKMPRKRSPSGNSISIRVNASMRPGRRCPGRAGGSAGGEHQPRLDASMRPGEDAPEEAIVGAYRPGIGLASMRPGRRCPGRAVLRGGQRHGVAQASMRPGRRCPGRGDHRGGPLHVGPYASMRPGRRCPGRARGARMTTATLPSFNEAGAKMPRKRVGGVFTHGATRFELQ